MQNLFHGLADTRRSAFLRSERSDGLSVLLSVSAWSAYLDLTLEGLLYLADEVCVIIPDKAESNLKTTLSDLVSRWGDDRLRLLSYEISPTIWEDRFEMLSRTEFLRCHNVALSETRYRTIWYWRANLLPLVKICRAKLEILRQRLNWQYYAPLPTLNQAYGWRYKLGIWLYRQFPFSEYAFWEGLMVDDNGNFRPSDDLHTRRYGLWPVSPTNTFRIEAAQIIPQIENLKHFCLGYGLLDLRLCPASMDAGTLRSYMYDTDESKLGLGS